MRKLSALLCLFLLTNLVSAKEIPFYNGGFEVWESTNVFSSYFMNMASGWDVSSRAYPIDLRPNDNYHSEAYQYPPRSGDHAMYFFDTGFSTPIQTKGYTLSEGTYTFSVYASTLGWANTYITLSASGDGVSFSEKYAVNSKSFSKFSLTFTLEETHTIYLGINNTRAYDGNGTITHFVADDCSLSTDDGQLISTEYEYISSDNQDFSYYLYSSGDAELIKCNTKGIGGTISLPSSITKNGITYKVRRICPNAFSGCTNIKEIILPSYLTEIGEQAFSNCSSLQNVIVSNRVTNISSKAFVGCTSLMAVEFFTKNKPNIATDAFPINSDLCLYVPNVYDYASINTLKIKSLGYYDSKLIYSGITPSVTFSSAPGVTIGEIDNSNLIPNAGAYNLPTTFTHSSGLSVAGFVYFEILKKSLTITANDASRTYGENNPNFTATYDGFVNNENETYLESLPTMLADCNQASPVGSYIIVVDNAKSRNYDITYKNGTLLVNKAELVLIVNDCSKTYGQPNPTFTSRYEGLKNNETIPAWVSEPTYTTEADKNSDVGVYDVYLTGGVARNYDLDCKAGLLTIDKAQLLIKADNKYKAYFEPNPIFTYTCSGFLNSDDENLFTKEPLIECSATILSNAGEYNISISGAECKNYTIGYETGKLIVNKRILNVYPHDVSRKYAEENPNFSCEIDGFVNNEDEKVLVSKPIIYTNATSTSDVGTYVIYAKDGDADNYTFNYQQGTLTINKADQIITWDQVFDNINVGDQLELLATASSGLDIEYIFDTDIVSMYEAGSKVYLDCLAAGVFSIRATQSGNKNYNAAVRVAKSISIIDPSGISDVIAESYANPIYYDLSGKKISSPQKGSFIIRIDKGKIQKIFVQ